MEGYIDALELTVIALVALIVISFCFVGLSRGLQWMAGLSGRGGAGAARKKAIIAAAVRGYLESEREDKK